MTPLSIIMQLRSKILPKITKIIEEFNRIKIYKLKTKMRTYRQIESLNIIRKNFSKKIIFR